MRRNKVWNKSCISPLIESLFFNRCFQVAGFDYLFTITIPKYLRPLSKSSTYGRKSVSSSGSNHRGFWSEVSLPLSLVGKKGVSEPGCVC